MGQVALRLARVFRDFQNSLRLRVRSRSDSLNVPVIAALVRRLIDGHNLIRFHSSEFGRGAIRPEDGEVDYFSRSEPKVESRIARRQVAAAALPLANLNDPVGRKLHARAKGIAMA